MQAVEADVYERFEMEVPSRYIGERIFEATREVDEVAFVRFASVYRSSKTSTISWKSSNRSSVPAAEQVIADQCHQPRRQEDL